MQYTIYKGRPIDITNRLQKEIDCYDFLDKLNIQYERIDHEAISTMECLKDVREQLNASINKNLFLTNHQQSKFYLLLMPGDKPFKTKELSKQINSSRLSFANEEKLLEMLNVTPGSVSILSLIYDHKNEIQLLIDKDLLNRENWGMHPCINTSSLKIKRDDILNIFLPDIKHEPIFVTLNGGETL